MDVIQSRIDTSSDLYRKNFADMESLVADLEKEMSIAMEDRSRKAKDRLKESGKIPAAQKLELLLDKNSPFLEIAPLAAKGMYDGKWLYFEDDGTIIGIGECKKGTGKQRGWYRNSVMKREVNFVDNQKHGQETWYNADGTIARILTFEYGELISTQEF